MATHVVQVVSPLVNWRQKSILAALIYRGPHDCCSHSCTLHQAAVPAEHDEGHDEGQTRVSSWPEQSTQVRGKAGGEPPPVVPP